VGIISAQVTRSPVDSSRFKHGVTSTPPRPSIEASTNLERFTLGKENLSSPNVMRLDVLKSYALSLPHTTVVKQWGECLVFKVAGKMFLLIALDAETIDGVVFKCTPDEFDELTEIDGITQAPYCAKRLWVRVADLTALPAAELQRRIRHSYDLVVAKLTKKLRLELGL